MNNYITSIPYRSEFLVKQYGNTVRLIYLNSVRESGWEEVSPSSKSRKKRSLSDVKSYDNIRRAKNKVFEYALCNPFTYFVTLTFDKKKVGDRYDFESLQKALSEFIHNLNRFRPSDKKIKYVFVPERHKDGAIHFHGLLLGITKEDLNLNIYGHLTWSAYADRFGFVNISPIRSQAKCASYISKYITKALAESVVRYGGHLYYASNGLETATVLYRGYGEFLGEYDWKHPDGYCSIKNYDSLCACLEEFVPEVER